MPRRARGRGAARRSGGARLRCARRSSAQRIRRGARTLTRRADDVARGAPAAARPGAMNVDHEIGLLIAEVTRLGAPSAAHGGKIAARRAPSAAPRPLRGAGRGVPHWVAGADARWCCLARVACRAGQVWHDCQGRALWRLVRGVGGHAARGQEAQGGGLRGRDAAARRVAAERGRSARRGALGRLGVRCVALPRALTARRAGAHDHVDVVLLRDSYP